MLKVGDGVNGRWTQGRVVGFMSLDENEEPITDRFIRSASVACTLSPIGSCTEVRVWDSGFDHLTNQGEMV